MVDSIVDVVSGSVVSGSVVAVTQFCVVRRSEQRWVFDLQRLFMGKGQALLHERLEN